MELRLRYPGRWGLALPSSLSLVELGQEEEGGSES